MRKIPVAGFLATLLSSTSFAGFPVDLSPLATPTPTRTPARTPTPKPTPTPTPNPNGVQDISSCGNVLQSVRLVSDIVTSDSGCLIVRASGVTVDGNGHSITASGANGAGYAVSVMNVPDVTISNLSSAQGIQIYGSKAARAVLDNVTVGVAAVFMGDGFVVRNSHMRTLALAGIYNDPVQRAVVTGNVIEGPDRSVLYINNSDSNSNCFTNNVEVSNNLIHGTLPASQGSQILAYLHCGSLNTISGNTLVSEGDAVGFYMRDSFDGSLFESNVVSIASSTRGGVNITTGSSGYHAPRNNIFRNNFFYVKSGRVFWASAGQFEGNSFFNNVFLASTTVEALHITGGVNNVFDHNTFFNSAHGNLLLLESFVPPGNSYSNNIFVNLGPSHYSLSGQYDMGGYHGDHNLFWNPEGKAVFWGKWSLADWQNYSAQDLTSFEANPQFVDPYHGNFAVNSTSPAIGAASDGTTIGAVQ